jgi:hypothetical protein
MSTKITNWLTTKMFPDSAPGIFVESISSKGSVAEGILFPLERRGWSGCYYCKNKNTDRRVYPYITNLDQLQALLLRLKYDSFINCVVIKQPTQKDLTQSTFFEVFRCGVIICRHDWNHTLRQLLGYTLNNLKYGCYHWATSPKKQHPIDIYVAKIRKPPYFYRQVIPDLNLPLPGRYLLHRVLKSGTGSMSVLLLKREGFHQKLVLKKCLTPELYRAEKTALLTTQDWKHSPDLVYYDDHRNYLVTDWCGRDLRDAKESLQHKLKRIIQNITNRLHQKYAIYHNDVRWKNIVRDNGKLVLVDWGFSSPENRERDPQGILK